MKTLSLLLLSLSAAAAAPLVTSGDNWNYRKGTSAPQANWQSLPDVSLDASWLVGPGGFGYGDNDDATLLSDMGGASGYRTVYIRQEFSVAAGELVGSDKLILSIDYDDAYVAYLDGVEIARSSNAPGSPGTEPAFTDGPSTTREAGTAQLNDLGLVSAVLPEGTHVLAILGMNESDGSSDFSLIANLYTQAPPPPLHWTLADSPIVLNSTYDVLSGQTLTIDAGVEVHCPDGSNAISCQGTVIANGTEAERIRFIPATPGGNWNRLEFLGPSESRLIYCDFERADSSGIIRGRNSDVYLDHCRFIDVDVQMIDLIDSSCTIQYCEFDSIINNELLHFSNMPPAGHAWVAYNRFGLPGVPTTSGYNDIIDFTGGNRPGPIVRFIGNVFLSAVDDVFDMDGSDAHIEGNIFIDVRKEAARASSSSPITTGASGGDLSELVIARNFFVNCEHNVLIKDSGTVLIQNNSSLTFTPNALSNNTSGGGNEAPGIVIFGEPWRGDPYGDGVYYQGNIAADLQVTEVWPLFSNASTSTDGCFLRQDFNCIEGFPQPGSGNLSVDPLYVDRSGVDSTNVLQKLALQAGSPCIGSGPNGIDMGALVPMGASISGEPSGTTSDTGAVLSVAGPGIWAYKWRINGGGWSDELSLVPQAIWDGAPLTETMFDGAPSLELTDLADGDYTVEVIGKNSAGDWQEVPTVSRTWTVASGPSDLDGDGMPDDWENANGLNPNDPNDAAQDADADGLSNLGEFIAGTLPNDPGSKLAITSVSRAGADSVITFEAVAGKSYQLQFSTDLAGNSWTGLQTIPVASEGTQIITDPGGGLVARKYYRVVTPSP